MLKLFKKSTNKKGSATSSPAESDLDGINPEAYQRRWWILAAMCLALLGVMLANSSLNMGLPMMASDLDLSQLDLTWIVNVYTLVFASFLFIAGAVGDRYGRKRAMQFGLAIFTAGALYAAIFAQTGAELIVSRTIMGLGGAFVMPTTLSIINNVFPKRQRARAIAIWSAVAGVGMMFGSIISGVLLEHFSWHSLFYFSALLAGAGLVVNQYLVLESKDESESPVDWLGGVLSTIGIFGVVYGITEAPSEGVLEPVVLFSLLGGIVAIVAFILWELRTKSPMLDMKLFKNKSFAVSSLTLTLVFLAMAGVFFSMSLIMQMVMGYSPLESSLLTIPIMLPMMFISPIVPTIVKKIGARNTISGGLILVTAAFLLMQGWTQDLAYPQMFGTLFVMMLGISLAMTPGTNILMASVPRNRSGMGSAMNDTTRELGSALGVAILGAILASTYENEVSNFASAFPADVQAGIESSIAVAITIAEQMGPAGDAITLAAKEAFMIGVSQSAAVAAGIIFTSALVAYIGLPKRSSSAKSQ